MLFNKDLFTQMNVIPGLDFYDTETVDKLGVQFLTAYQTHDTWNFCISNIFMKVI
jgi:hypothetical protein